jgi:uncharacterized protein with HEPN domain
MRNRLTHGYFDINIEVVWRTVQINSPRVQPPDLLPLDSRQSQRSALTRERREAAV